MSFFSPFKRRLPSFVAVLGIGSCIAACSPGGASAPADGAGASSMGGSAPSSDAKELAFLSAEPLFLSPREEHVLSVRVRPRGFHRVSFALLTDEQSGTFDGFFEQADVVTDEDGIARNTLTAPARPGVFRVRASASKELYVERTVSVSDAGFAALQVVPEYTGVRSVESWNVQAHLEASCEELPNFWGEGELSATSAEEVSLSHVPVVDRIAIVIRSGKFVSGCSNVDNLQGDETRTLSISVSDRPLQLAGATLPVILGLEERSEAFISLLAQAAQDGASATGADTPGEATLAAMRAEIATTGERNAFDELLNTPDLQEALAAHFANVPAPQQLISELLLDAATRLEGPNALLLSLQLEKDGGHLELESAAGIPANRSGFLGSAAVSVESQPRDELLIGGDLKFQPTQFLYALADASTGTEEDAPSIPQLLAESLDCTGLAELLEVHSLDGSCDADCQSLRCERGLGELWRTAGASGEDLVSVRIGITAVASVDEEARPVALKGTWVGSLDSGQLSVAGPVGDTAGLSEQAP